MKHKIYSLACMVIANLSLLSSCDAEKPIKISPQTITVDSKEQDILFRTNRPYWSVAVWSETTGYTESEISENITDEISITSMDWFRLEWKRRLEGGGEGQSDEILLHLEENKNKEDRLLRFSAECLIQNVVVNVTQRGTASLE